MASKLSPFSADKCDEIRKLYAAGKKSIVISKRKFVFSAAAQKGHILVKPADGELVPMANIQSKALLDRKKKEWRDEAAKVHNNVEGKSKDKGKK